MYRHLIVLAFATSLLLAGEAPPAKQPRHITFVTGTVTIGQNLATMVVPDDCRFLAAADARFWMEQIWNNPPDPEIQGMVVPVDLADWYNDLIANTKPDMPARSWGMVVSWAGETGHVEDNDAKATDFTALLKEMQEGVIEANPERVKSGYDSVELLGWAEPPHYDSAAKKLYWAKSLRFNGSKDMTLNYCIRILGARGVLELNAVDSVQALPQVTEIAKQILTGTDFTSSNRYADYKSGIDPVAAGGIAALIGGGLIAKKIGIFAVFGVFILKFIKILLIPLIFIGAWVMKRIKGS